MKWEPMVSQANVKSKSSVEVTYTDARIGTKRIDFKCSKIEDEFIISETIGNKQRLWVMKEVLSSCQPTSVLSVSLYDSAISNTEARKLAKCLNSLKIYLESIDQKSSESILAPMTPLTAQAELDLTQEKD